MSRLDILSQTPSRLVEAPAPRSSHTSGGQEGSSGTVAEGGDFSSMLDGFSKEILRDAQETVDNASSTSANGSAGSPLIPSSIDMEALQRLLPDVNQVADSAATAAAQAGSQAYAVLEGLLPRILPQVERVGSNDQRQQGGALWLSPAPLSMDLAENGLATAAMGSRMMVSVQHQETHFKPIIEGLNTEQASTDTPALEGEAVMFLKAEIAQKSGAGAKNMLSEATELSSDPVSFSDGETVRTENTNETEYSGLKTLERVSARLEASRQAGSEGVKPDDGSLPQSTLQRLAGAILDDVRSIEQAPSAHPADGMNRVALAKASGGVLRVLNLQLNPIELGLVTIKMRLSGDSLEMELQAEKEETAQLLRNDTEKLSSLLRGSGYRPDIITIQSTEASMQDRSSPTFRPQGGFSQDQAFQQGAPNQGDRSHQQSRLYGQEEAGLHKDASDDITAAGRMSGGIYL
jgi:chemotaxis protein MotD